MKARQSRRRHMGHVDSAQTTTGTHCLPFRALQLSVGYVYYLLSIFQTQTLITAGGSGQPTILDKSTSSNFTGDAFGYTRDMGPAYLPSVSHRRSTRGSYWRFVWIHTIHAPS